MKPNIICFLTVHPCEKFYIFCKKLKNVNYDIYICIDDDNYVIPNYDKIIPIIKINKKICENAGFKSSVLWLNNTACSRDKALYYFCKNNIDYNFLWLIEDDVFIPKIDTIKNIDIKYKNNDLLCSGNDIIYEKQTGWHWDHINSQIKIPPPYSTSMICAIRISKKLLACIKNYVKKYNNLFMDEALFTTLALQANLDVVNPIELSTILYRNEWQIWDIKKEYLYHPIKDINLQYKYRKQLI